VDIPVRNSTAHRRKAWFHEVCRNAKPLQPAISRRRTRDDPFLQPNWSWTYTGKQNMPPRHMLFDDKLLVGTVGWRPACAPTRTERTDSAISCQQVRNVLSQRKLQSRRDNKSGIRNCKTTQLADESCCFGVAKSTRDCPNNRFQQCRAN
jgi:hypothetical protein